MNEYITNFINLLRYINGWRPGEGTEHHQEVVLATEQRRIDTGRLRQLKQIAGRGFYPGAMPIIGPYLPPNQDVHWAYWLTAGLFGLFPSNHGTLSFPRACALLDLRVYREGKPRRGPEPNDITPFERRFTRLLRSTRHDIETPMVAIVRRLAREGGVIPFNYFWLLQDLCRWEEGTQDVKRLWGQQFWRNHAPDPDTTEAKAQAVADAENEEVRDSLLRASTQTPSADFYTEI